MNNKIFGVLLGIIVSALFYHILSQRCSIVIGSGIVEKYKDCYKGISCASDQSMELQYIFE